MLAEQITFLVQLGVILSFYFLFEAMTQLFAFLLIVSKLF